MAGPNQGEVYDGYRYMGGDPKAESSWQQAGPIDVSASWGAGARQLPNGTIERVGPRGGVTQIGTAEGRAGAGDDVGKLTEAQGKAVLYGSMMAGGERDYQEARRDGYNPASARNQLADFADLIPFDGGAIPRLIRNDVSDRGVQAERRFTEANLRQLSGAAVTPSEVTRTVAINFDRGNDELTDQRRRTREETYRGTRATAGSGAAAIPAFPGSEVGPTDPVTGLPTYPTIAATAAPIIDATGPTDFGGPQGPGSGPDSPIDLGSLGPEDLLKLQAGQYVRRSDGTVYALPAAPFAAPAQEGDVREGNALVRTAEDRGWTPESAVAQRDNLNPILRQVDAFGRGFADMGSLEFADEIAAGGDALFGQGVGDSFGQRFRNNVAVQRAVDEDDGRDAGFARGLGEVAGGVAGAFIGGPAALRSVANIRSPLLRGALTFGRNAATGAALAGTAAAGNERGDALARAQAALKVAPAAAALGGVIGLAAPAVVPRVTGALQGGARFLGRQVGRLGEAAGVPNSAALTERATPDALSSAIDRFGARMGPARVSALADRTQRARDLNIEPNLITGLDDGSIGRVRALATRDTPTARDAAVLNGENAPRRLPSRLRSIVADEISDDARPTLQVMDELTQSRRANAGAISDFGADPVALSDDAVLALRSDLSKGALSAAARRAQGSLDPEVRASANRLNQLASTVLDDPANASLTVREAQDISKALNEAADAAYRSNAPADGPVLSGLAKAIRQSGRDSSEGYSNWLQQYGADSDLIEAATTGRNFISVSDDPVNARSTDAFVDRAVNATPDELLIQRQAAAQAAQAAGSNARKARNVLEGFAGDEDQYRRLDALGLPADRVQARSRAELDNVARQQRASPRVGSETSTNQQDAAGAAGDVLGDIGRVVRNPVAGLIDVTARRFQARGFSNAEAEALVNAALDPAQTDDLVRMLSQRMSRREARSLARAVHRSLISATGSSSVQ